MSKTKTIELPRYMLERDFSANEWIIWDTQLHEEVMRGTRVEMEFVIKDM